MALFLGIDLGTSYFKAGLFSEEGEPRGLGRRAAPVRTVAPGRREMDSEAFWQVLREVVHSALYAAKVQPREVAGVSYSSQANTFLLLGAQSRPLTPLISWQDVRAVEINRLEDYWESDGFFRTTGISRYSPHLMAGKLQWFRRNEPDIWKETRQVLTISDYLASELTGSPVGDTGTASLTGFWDIPGDTWHNEAVESAGLRPEFLPRLARPGSSLGGLSRKGADRLGLAPGTVFAAGTLDHHAAAIGSGVGRFAPVSLSTGTVLAAFRVNDAWEPIRGGFHGPDWKPGRFFSLTVDECGAGIVEAFLKRYASDLTFEELLDLAGRVPPDAEIPPVPAEAWQSLDHWNPEGLSPADPSCRAVLVRALLEAICRRQRHLLENLCGSNLPEAAIATGGGARSPLWLQIQADILEARILAAENAERACLGAAVLASAGAGLSRDADEASRRMVAKGTVYEPNG